MYLRAPPCPVMPDLDLPLTRDVSASRDAPAPDRSLNALVGSGLQAAYRERAPEVTQALHHDASIAGTQFAASALARGGYGQAADPAVNRAVAEGLRMPEWREALLPSGLTGTQTAARVAQGRPVGDDVVVLLDREAAAGFGHTAVLVGNDVGGWTLHSKDGTDRPTGTLGRPMWTNDNGQGQREGAKFARYPTLDAFFDDSAAADRYEAAVRVEFEGGANRGPAARAAATAIVNETYDVLQSSCAHVVQGALQAVQANSAYGVEGFSVRETVAFRGVIRPNAQFSRVEQQEGADDRPSDAQRAWAARSATDGR